MRVPLPAAITTTFNAMRLSLIKAAIIGVLLALLAGCSTLRLAYNNGPFATWWWLDGYLDVPSEQAPRVKAAIEDWFAWNRGAQLPDIAALLTTASNDVLLPTTPGQVCLWQQQWRDRLDPALQRALQQGAELLPGLGEEQWRHLEGRFTKKNAEMRQDFLQPDPAERLKASIQRVVDRAEMLYGRLDEPQRRVIAAGVAASPFDPQAWMSERERRQRETLQTLRRLEAERADRDRRLAALRLLADRVERSADPAYRSYQAHLRDYNCAFVAQLHNATTAVQRQAARERLQGWAQDLRALSAPQ
jgi:hypothetical protein